MKKKFLLCLILTFLLAFTGCSETEEKLNFDLDKNQALAYMEENILISYDTVNDHTYDYVTDAAKSEDADTSIKVANQAITGFKAAKETDKVGELPADFTKDVSKYVKLDKVENGARDNILVTAIVKYTNRDVKITASFTNNLKYYVVRDQQIQQAKQILVSTFLGENATEADLYTALMNTVAAQYADANIDTTSSDTILSDMYDLGALDSILEQYGISRPNNFIVDEVEVSAVYSKKELLSKAAENTAIGMGTVFVVLIFISFIISLLKFVPKLVGLEKKDEKAAKKAEKKAAKAAKKETSAPAAPATITHAAPVDDDSELVAVITAAIYAAEGKNPYTTDSKDKLIVRSIRRVR